MLKDSCRSLLLTKLPYADDSRRAVLVGAECTGLQTQAGGSTPILTSMADPTDAVHEARPLSAGRCWPG